jgi:hypothetical protein
MNQHQYDSTFGADPPISSDPHLALTNVWQSVQLFTPQWMKETVTIAAGVFGGLALFRIFQNKLPKAQ